MNRILVLSSVALSLSCGAAFAQTTDPQAAPQQAPAGQGYGHHRAPDPQRQAEHLSRKLNLTPDQTAKLEPILASQDQQMQALWQNQGITPQDRHQQMMAIHQQTEQQLAGVLTPDQLAQMKAMMHHRGHHGQNGQDGQAEPNQAPSA